DVEPRQAALQLESRAPDSYRRDDPPLPQPAGEDAERGADEVYDAGALPQPVEAAPGDLDPVPRDDAEEQDQDAEAEGQYHGAPLRDAEVGGRQVGVQAER